MIDNLQKNFMNIVIAQGALLESCEQALREKLSKDFDNIDTLLKLADVYRQMGNIRNAVESYHKILDIDPGHNLASYTASILTQQPIFECEVYGTKPCPYWQIDNFLKPQEILHLWDTIKENNDSFSSSMISKGLVSENRQSHVLYKKSMPDIDSWFFPKIFNNLNSALRRCHVTQFNMNRHELQLTMHLHDDYYVTHSDTNKENANSPKLTFVYYFHTLPKQYKGGDLLLFDTDTEEDEYSMKYTRISPAYNSVLFFPSTAFHQITPISLDTDNYLDGRYTLNGWIH